MSRTIAGLHKIIALGLLGLLAAAPVAGKPPSDLDAKVRAWAGTDQPGGLAVAWVDADGVAYAQAGRIDDAISPAITSDTLFEVASVTKVFTALLLAESERLGKVQRDAPAAKYLLPASDPDQARLSQLTLVRLATHTSGLSSLPSNIGPNPNGNPDPYATYTAAKLIQALRADGPKAKPGRNAYYSNFGAAILGDALASAWGTSYDAALRQHILGPLGMDESALYLASAPAPKGLAPAHVRTQTVPNWSYQAFAPAGALCSTTKDLGRFLQACLGQLKGNPLQAALVETEVPQHKMEDVGGMICLGWVQVGGNDNPCYWHNGESGGTTAFIGFCPTTQTAVAILTNRKRSCDALGFSLLGRPVPSPTIAPVAHAESYEGIYTFSPAFAIVVTSAEGRLVAQPTRMQALQLRPIEGERDRFALTRVPAEITFSRGADGRIDGMVLHQNGTDQSGTWRPLPPQPKEVLLSDETLRDYVGNYALSATLILEVAVRDGRLIVQPTGQSAIPLFASAKDEFFCKLVQAKISFERDSEGRVSGLVLHQFGRDSAAPKQ